MVIKPIALSALKKIVYLNRLAKGETSHSRSWLMKKRNRAMHDFQKKQRSEILDPANVNSLYV